MKIHLHTYISILWSHYSDRQIGHFWKPESPDQIKNPRQLGLAGKQQAARNGGTRATAEETEVGLRQTAGHE